MQLRSLIESCTGVREERGKQCASGYSTQISTAMMATICFTSGMVQLTMYIEQGSETELKIIGELTKQYCSEKQSNNHFYAYKYCIYMQGHTVFYLQCLKSPQCSVQSCIIMIGGFVIASMLLLWSYNVIMGLIASYECLKEDCRYSSQ